MKTTADYKKGQSIELKYNGTIEKFIVRRVGYRYIYLKSAQYSEDGVFYLDTQSESMIPKRV
jgi:hypothetical protein